MFGEIKKQFYLRWNEMLMILGMEWGSFLFGEIMMIFAVYGMGEKESIFPIGTMMVIVFLVIIMVFCGISSLPLYFNILISMGMTRRRLVPALFGFAFLENVIGAWIAYLFYLLEKWFFQIAYAGIPNELDLQFVFRWKYIVPVCMAVVALNGLVGALFLKFGKKVFTIFWILWMTVCIGATWIGRTLESEQDHTLLRVCRRVEEWFCGFSESGILMTAVLISAGLIAVAYMLLRKQQINI